MAGETLAGDNKYSCDSCNAKVTATRRASIRSLPPVLIVALKRFEYDFETMAMVAHALKGSLLTLGFHGAGEAARTLEEAARRNDREGCEPATQALLTQLEHVESVISDGLARWRRDADV